MEPSRFDEVEFFRAVHHSGVRALLIGRRALVVMGLPVLTADYDFWLAIEDIAPFNGIGEQFDLHPTCTPDEARRRGRYVLESDEHMDVLVARNMTTLDGHVIAFDTMWARKREITLGDVPVSLPSVDDLILTKINPRPKDLEDIRLLRIIKEQRT